jgi:hypothetical protein
MGQWQQRVGAWGVGRHEQPRHHGQHTGWQDVAGLNMLGVGHWNQYEEIRVDEGQPHESEKCAHATIGNIFPQPHPLFLGRTELRLNAPPTTLLLAPADPFPMELQTLMGLLIPEELVNAVNVRQGMPALQLEGSWSLTALQPRTLGWGGSGLGSSEAAAAAAATPAEATTAPAAV